MSKTNNVNRNLALADISRQSHLVHNIPTKQYGKLPLKQQARTNFQVSPERMNVNKKKSNQESVSSLVVLNINTPDQFNTNGESGGNNGCRVPNLEIMNNKSKFKA